jgi:hypothetical protein
VHPATTGPLMEGSIGRDRQASKDSSPA